jgi:hypothetical protein
MKQFTPEDIRKVIYTTNATPSVNMTLRKVTRNHRIFPSDEAVYKVVYLAMCISKSQWTMPIREWQTYVVVRLPDGQPGVVLRFLCENLQIDTAAQTQRIRRTEAISEDLVFTQVETNGGYQRMAVLILHAVPF